MELTHQKNHDTVIGTCEVFAYKYGTSGGSTPYAEGTLKFESKGAAYWVLALSLVMLVYQVIALLQLFCKSGILNARKVCCKSTVTIFSIFVSAKPSINSKPLGYSNLESHAYQLEHVCSVIMKSFGEH